MDYFGGQFTSIALASGALAHRPQQQQQLPQHQQQEQQQRRSADVDWRDASYEQLRAIAESDNFSNNRRFIEKQLVNRPAAPTPLGALSV